MARGKGALRIAIEDFFETTKIGKWLSNYWRDFCEELEGRYIEPYRDIFLKLGDATGLEIFSQIGKVSVPPEGHFAWLPAILGAIFGLFFGIIQGFAKPFGILAEYASNRTVFPAHLSPEEAVIAHWRKIIQYDYLRGELHDLGYADERIDLLLRLYERYITPDQNIELWKRGEISDQELKDRLFKEGFPEYAVEDMKKLAKVIPSVGDLIRMAVRDAFSPEVVKAFKYDEGFPTEVLEHTRKQGIDDEWVRRFWYAHWELPSPQMGYEMLHRLRPGRSKNPFSIEDLRLLLKTADYAPYFRDRLIEISYQPITRVDIRRMYKLGIFDKEEVKQRYMDLGYTEQDAQALTEFTVKYEDEDGTNIKEKVKSLSLSAATKMFKKGLLTESEYRQKLSQLGYPDDVVNLYVELANMELRGDALPDYHQDYTDNVIKNCRKAYAARMIDEDDIRQMLSSLGLPEDQINYIVAAEDYEASLNDLNDELKLIVDSYLTQNITREEFIGKLGELGLSGKQQQKVIENVELQLAYRTRKLTEAQYRAAAKSGIITIDEYRKNLIGLGYSDNDIDILIKLYNLEGEE